MTNGNDTINPCHPNTDKGGGLTKREYFAAMAMQGLASINPNGTNMETAISGDAAYAVRYADALIKALNQ